MSTFVDKAINPKTKKIQEAWFIDDFYGQRLYAVAFHKDGTDAIFDSGEIELANYDTYPMSQIKLPKILQKLDK